MSKTPFKGLSEALRASAEWASIDRAWRDSEDLMASLRATVPAHLRALALQVRRDDPPRGIRGSQVTVVAMHAAAAAKLRLALADWPQMLRQQGWGIQHIRVTAQQEQTVAPVRAPHVRRPDVPGVIREEFERLAHDMPNERLRQALRRIAKG